MSKRLLAVFFVLLVAGGFGVLAANDQYTYVGKWFGFVTDSLDLNLAHKITPDAVKKSVTEKGAKYVLINGLFWGQKFLALEPQEKAAPFAGQQVFVHGSITTNSLTKARVYITDSGSGGAGGAWVINISSITPHVDDSLY